MILIDACGWIEFFTDGPLSGQYEKHFLDLSRIITPTIVLYEVFKKVRRERQEEEVLITVAQMQKTRIIELTAEIAFTAAEFGLKHRLPMADSIVYATARTAKAQVVTSDPHFEGLDNVMFIR